jgi:hypothetical protein
MATLTIKGTIVSISDIINFDSGFFKRDLVITENEGQFPQTLSIDFPKDKANLLDKFKVNQYATVECNVRGSLGNNGKHYVSLSGWKITGDDTF